MGANAETIAELNTAANAILVAREDLRALDRMDVSLNDAVVVTRGVDAATGQATAAAEALIEYFAR